MINYIPFYTHIWSDKKFKKLSVQGRLLFIYLFANNSVNLTGIYELDLDICRLKINLNSAFDSIFAEVCQSHIIKWDELTETIFIINRFKLIPNKSPKVIQGVINELNIINHPYKAEFIDIYKDHLREYMANLKCYEDKDFNLLNKEQIQAFVKLGWHKDRLKKFYMDRDYPEQKIDSILSGMLPKII